MEVKGEEIMTNEEKFFPCPFCGSDNLRKSNDFGVDNKGFLKLFVNHVQCNDCGAAGPTTGMTKEFDWNSRSDEK
jgi:predicted RNA-binding Zn-ribbon protein involved in translation (DUF1610 family)